jgi:hypothetical protein
VGGALTSFIPAAAAQTGAGYPPADCAVLVGSQAGGELAVGQTLTITVAPTCVYTPGASVTVVVNGVSAGAKVVNANGTVTVTITAVSETTLSVNPQVPARCGVNTMTVTGPSAVAGGRTVTQNVTFNLRCAAVAPKVASPLARTGANVARYGGAALVLLVAGSLIVMASRRRRADSTVG